jgi:hypothetical protein
VGAAEDSGSHLLLCPLSIVIFETHVSPRACDIAERNAKFEVLGLLSSNGSGCLLQQ